MQKTLEFLEQNVQWLALVVAGLFFGLCVYWYVLTPPAQIVSKVSKEPLTPQNVDELIRAGPVLEIKREREKPTSVAISVPDVVKPWHTQMFEDEAQPLAVTYPPPRYDPHESVGGVGPENPEFGADLVKVLPELPKATPLTAGSGLSVASLPQVPQGGGAQQVAAAPFDLAWAMESVVLSANDLKAAFLKVENDLNQKRQSHGQQPYQFTTVVLKVELQRQRGWIVGQNGPQFPNGDAGVETVAPSKILHNVHPLPDKQASIAEKAAYYDWAEKNIELVYQPKFYDVTGGDPWQQPALPGAAGAAAAAPGGAAVAAPPAAKGLAGIPPALPPRTNLPPVQPNLRGPGDGGNKNNIGQIVPDTFNQDILMWAVDDSVQPGQVYRYRVVYYMKNPVIGQKGIADPSIIEQLEVKSPPSDWSGPVTIPQVTKFWFARTTKDGAQADIYIWKGGAWTKKANVPINPGDRVADSEWTVIDVHNGNKEREKYVILTNENGEVIRRYPYTDRSSDDKKNLDAQLNPAAAAGAGNGPGPNTPPPAAPARTPPAAPGMRAGVIPRGGG